MKLTVLGTSPPILTMRPGHAGTGLVVSTGELRFLLDCGPGVMASLVEAAIDPRSISRVFLTHHHWDHIADLPAFVLGRFELGLSNYASNGHLPEVAAIYGPAPTARITDLLFGPDGVFGPDIATRLAPELGGRLYAAHGAPNSYPSPVPVSTNVDPGLVWEGSGVTVEAVAAQHCQPYLLSLAYKITGSDGIVVFSGDSAECPAIVDLARGADLLVHEGGVRESSPLARVRGSIHSSATSVGETAAAAGVGRLLVVHHGLTVAPPDDRDAVCAEIRKSFAGEIEIARRFMTVTI